MEDLLKLVKDIVRERGVNPQDFKQTLRESNLKRWGNASILRKNGMGIDEVFDEFSAMYPWMFQSLDDFVEALSNRLTLTKEDLKDPEQEILEAQYTSQEGQDSILVTLQQGIATRTLNRDFSKQAIEALKEDGLIKMKGKRLSLAGEGFNRILKLCLYVEGEEDGHDENCRPDL